MLDKEYKYFEKNRIKLFKKYKNRFVVIKGEQVIGDYSSEVEAYSTTSKEHEVGTFLIQKCVKNTKELVQNFHSRVVF